MATLAEKNRNVTVHGFKGSEVQGFISAPPGFHVGGGLSYDNPVLPAAP